MELARQIISNNQTVRSKTVQDLKEFNSETLSTQAKKRRVFKFYDVCYYKRF